MCVVSLDRWFENCPPMAIMPPQMASLSPGGSSATVACTFEKKKRGSGVKGRMWTSLFLRNEKPTHSGVTTGIITRSASG